MNYEFRDDGSLFINGKLMGVIQESPFTKIIRHLESKVTDHEKNSQFWTKQFRESNLKLKEALKIISEKDSRIQNLESELKAQKEVSYRLSGQMMHKNNAIQLLEEEIKSLQDELSLIQAWRNEVQPLLRFGTFRGNSLQELLDFKMKSVSMGNYKRNAESETEADWKREAHKKLEEKFIKVSELNEAHKKACIQWERLMNNLVHEDGFSDVEKAILAMKSALFTAVDIYHMRAAGIHDKAYADELQLIQELKNLKEKGWLTEIIMPEKILVNRIHPVEFTAPATSGPTDPVSIGIWKRKHLTETEKEMDYLEKAMRNDDLLANNGMPS